MSASFVIELESLRFFAPHGVYADEALTGNEFDVSLRLETDGAAPVNHIDQTINYVEVYALVRAEFSQRTAFLETLCQRIAAQLHLRFPALLRVEIKIRKRTAAIPEFSGTVGVTYTQDFKSIS